MSARKTTQYGGYVVMFLSMKIIINKNLIIRKKMLASHGFKPCASPLEQAMVLKPCARPPKQPMVLKPYARPPKPYTIKPWVV